MSTCKRMWTDREIRSMADESAKIRIEAGLTENAKPIYCHPIAIYDTSNADTTKRFMFTCLIFNNDDKPFTKDSFYAFVRDIQPSGGGYGRIMISGGNENTSFSSITWKTDEESLFVEGWDLSTKAYDGHTISISPASVILSDGVNKIN